MAHSFLVFFLTIQAQDSYKSTTIISSVQCWIISSNSDEAPSCNTRISFSAQQPDALQEMSKIIITSREQPWKMWDTMEINNVKKDMIVQFWRVKVLQRASAALLD